MASEPRAFLAEVQEAVDTERVLRDGDPFYEVQGYLPDGTPLMECNRWERVGLDASAAMADALTAVLDLHKPAQFSDDPAYYCVECANESRTAYYPCPTVRAITEHLGGEHG